MNKMNINPFKNLPVSALMGLLLFSCSGGRPEPVSREYSNPVIPSNCPDPSVLDNRSRDGYFYAYSTQSGSGDAIKYIPVYRSKDLVDWEPCGAAFTAEGHPAWVEGARLWAPDANYVDGHYVLYYAMGVWGDHIHSCAGVAVSDSPTGPFEDKGMIVDYASTGVTNCIDANFFEDSDGRRYLCWGSFGKGSGIWGAELSSDGLSLKDPKSAVQLTRVDTEGAYLHKHGKDYYLFASIGSCCEGEKSTYRVIVGRSKSPLGPFVSPSGKSMLEDDYDYVMLHASQDKVFIGTGHNSEIVTDDKGDDWMFYHAFWKGNDYKGRCLMMDKIQWDKEGWPHVSGGEPSSTATGPSLRLETK